MPNPTPSSDLTYRLVRLSEASGDVVTQLQAHSSSPEVVVVVLDLDQGWSVGDAARWIQSFRQEYQQRLPVYTGQKDYWRSDKKDSFRPVPMVRVFKSSVTDQEHAELVAAGAGVYDRSSLANKDCQTPEQMLNRFAALRASGTFDSVPLETCPDADPKAYNGYPSGVKPGSLGKLLQGGKGGGDDSNEIDGWQR